jgi:hypothetical protein
MLLFTPHILILFLGETVPKIQNLRKVLLPVKKSTKITGKKVGRPAGEKPTNFLSSLNIFTFDRCF